MSGGWIGVDLDGTLAHFGERDAVEHIGAPIPAMVERVQRWLAAGRDVRIFTARAAHDPDGSARRLVEAWCAQHLGAVLPVTCAKDYAMVALYDDRCVQVEMNTGRLIGGGGGA